MAWRSPAPLDAAALFRPGGAVILGCLRRPDRIPELMAGRESLELLMCAPTIPEFSG
jgi:hypothetical protein